MKRALCLFLAMLLNSQMPAVGQSNTDNSLRKPLGWTSLSPGLFVKKELINGSISVEYRSVNPEAHVALVKLLTAKNVKLPKKFSAMPMARLLRSQLTVGPCISRLAGQGSATTISVVMLASCPDSSDMTGYSHWIPALTSGISEGSKDYEGVGQIRDNFYLQGCANPDPSGIGGCNIGGPGYPGAWFVEIAWQSSNGYSAYACWAGPQSPFRNNGCGDD